ncbi:hypothetical protein D3OALGA1CA_1815 [Olavius algarvensis associated proteobacterium Delta 3]|nr:hypothetical protein D3OALGA1CA_1815 [Olavius algarvensis associated proteobacterium Delta 3]CAB5136170.1 hypothetical protein D3OALGB2SA_3947 [Olavius algarvensis associated proteobacterium Delta 3]
MNAVGMTRQTEMPKTVGVPFVVFENMVHAQPEGGAVTLMPAEDSDVPAGSQISEERSRKSEKKVQEYKVEMKAKETEQQQEKSPQQELPGTKDPKEGN